jgi:DNA-binding NarL/FixJ family response regulator
MRLGSTLRRPRRHLAQALTDRETQIVRLVVEGKGNKAIANRLSLTEGTVKSHLRNIYRKLQVRTRAEAAAQAVQLDI